MLNLPNPSRWGRESKSYLGSGVVQCLSWLGMIEQHRLWGRSLRCGIDSETEDLGGFSSLQALSTILCRLLGVVWALCALETCRALLKGGRVGVTRLQGPPPTLCPTDILDSVGLKAL